MKQIKASDIQDEVTVCPYCMWECEAEPALACCGEVHRERAFITTDGELYLESEVEVMDEKEAN